MFMILTLLYHAFSFLLNKTIPRNSQPTVCYENEHFKFLNKPPDMRINSNNPAHYTLQTFLCNKYPKSVNSKLFHNFYFVHRLDFATSGIICIPMTKRACKVISEVFQTRSAEKYYIAIVRGFLSQRIIAVDAAIGEDCTGTSMQKMCTVDNKNCIKASARHARTLILALEDGFYENYAGTKILVRPITGRRHQIRVHCANLGHTIVGDYTYSNKMDIKPHRMFLHSLRLVLPNELESVDLQTDDPFTENAYKNWVVNKKYATVRDGYETLRQYANANATTM